MALKAYLFGKTAGRKGLLACEGAAFAYTALTSALILLLYGRMDHPLQMLAGRAMVVAATLALAGLYRLAPCRLVLFARIGTQLGLLSYWYPDTFEFNRLFPNLDHVFAAAEQGLFGGQPSAWFARSFPQMWASEPLNMGYVSYYPMILVVVAWYFFRRYEKFEEIGFVLAASFFLYYLIYIFLPVAGPQFYFPAIGEEAVGQGSFPPVHDYFNRHCELPSGAPYGHGFFYNLVEISQRVGERPTAAFPSSHVGISTILMILAWQASKRLFACLTPFYLLLCCATVYIQAHYLIDSLAGFASAFLIYPLTAWCYKACRRRPDASPLGTLSHGRE